MSSLVRSHDLLKTYSLSHLVLRDVKNLFANTRKQNDEGKEKLQRKKRKLHEK